MSKRVTLDPEQIEDAVAIAEKRREKYNSDFAANLTGALGEIGVGVWAASEPEAKPIEEAFRDLSRDDGPDLFLGPQRYGVDVKTYGVGKAFEFKESQVKTLTAKGIQAVIWVSEESSYDSFAAPAKTVLEIQGWSSVFDINQSPPANFGSQTRSVKTVRALPELLALL